MAVTIISKGNHSFLNKLGIDPVLLKAMDDAGITMNLGFFKMQLLNSQKGLLADCTFPVSVNTVMKNQVGAGVLKEIKNSATETIKTALYVVGGPLPVGLTEPSAKPKVNVKVTVEDTTKKLSAKLEANKILSEAKAEAIGEGVEVSPEEAAKMDAVPLAMATKMYQPVRGTSSSSRYFVVAIGEMVKVAARITGKDISVRVEGKLTPTIIKQFKGVELDDKSGYLSAHFSTTPELAARVLGAVLVGSGQKFSTPLPSFEKLKGMK